MSTVPTYLAPRAQTRRWSANRRAVWWCALAVAAALSSLLAGALWQSHPGRYRAVAPAAPDARAAGFSHEGLLSLPLAARGPVSATLGANAPVYRVSTLSGGFAADNPAQRLRSSFDGAGASLTSGTTQVGLSLQAFGYASSLRAVGAVAPRANANRVLYARPGLSEWYVNGPLGVEQGFTVARAPTGHPVGPLTLSIALSGNARASLSSDRQSLVLSHAGGPELRYSGLSAMDAAGHPLHSWLELRGARLLLRVDTRGARYPLRIDPFIHQGEKLNGSGLSGPYGYIGQSVALSADGDTALVGASGGRHLHRIQGGGVRVHALGLDVDAAGAKAHGRRRGRQRVVRRKRGAVRGRQYGVDRRSDRRRCRLAPRGCSRARARRGPSRAKS